MLFSLCAIISHIDINREHVMPNDKNDKFRGALIPHIAKFLGKKGLIAAGAASSDFREFSEGEFSKRFGPNFLKYVRDGS